MMTLLGEIMTSGTKTQIIGLYVTNWACNMLPTEHLFMTLYLYPLRVYLVELREPLKDLNEGLFSKDTGSALSL